MDMLQKRRSDKKMPTFDEYFKRQGCSIGYAIVLEQITNLIDLLS